MTTLAPPAQHGPAPGAGPAGAPRWEAPPPVEDSPVRGVRDVLSTIHRVVGLSTAGWVGLAVVLVCVAGYLLTGWTELALVAVLVALLVVMALAFTIGRPRYEVALSLADHRVVVGEDAAGRLAVRNAAGRRALPSRLDMPVGHDAASFQIPSLGGGAHHDEDFEIPTRRRGVVPVGPAQSVQGDPFSLSGRTTDWTEMVELYVHPHTVNLPGRQTGFVHDLEGHASNVLTNSDMSFHALREYVPGDDRRHIHWRSSARTGDLMVRQFEETRQSRVALALDTARASYLDEAEFELAVSVVGSVAIQCLREDNPLALMTADQTVASVSALRTLDELCRVEMTGHGSVFGLVTAIKHREPSASIVILTTGSTAGVDRVRRAVSSFDVDTRVVAVVANPSAASSVRTVSNVTVMRVPDLTGLPRAFRQAMQ